ncbi:MAG: hypothetical protein WC939_00345 [Acholeplasmataceae bacterium]
MTKSLMISIHKKHVDNIKNKLKTLELRTWLPKLNGLKGIWVYIYEPLKNNGVGGVIGRFWFDGYATFEYTTIWGESDYISNNGVDSIGSWRVDGSYLDKLCLDYQDVLDYGFREKPKPYQKTLYAWHINNLEIFDKPKELSDFYKRIDGLDEDGKFMLSSLKDGETVTIPELKKKYLLSKPPQRSVWVYTKELENEII